jgi:ppGpp synthetase/RelA/SpoT-type nucleotidyltranferase
VTDVIDGAKREIELEVLHALAGADEVKRQLLFALAMGHPSLESQVYLLKCRVKSHDSFLNKVIEKREEDAGYLVSDVTDVVGLRILTLYQSELPLVVREFLRFMEWAQKEPISLFFGAQLSDAIKEIIIYRSASGSKYVFDSVLRELSEKSFHPKAQDAVRSPVTNVGAAIEIAEKESSYSSIHIVVWCNGISPSDRFKIPMEVQFRTSLEDMWGEVDHRLKYKLRQADSGRKLITESTQYKNTVSFLKPLKTSLDACSATADQIAEQVAAMFEAMSYEARQNLKSVSVDLDRLNSLGLPTVIQKQVNTIATGLVSLYQRIYESAFVPDARLIDEAIEKFDTYAGEFDVVLRKYDETKFPERAKDIEVRYRFQLERALCLYWKAFLLKVRSEKDPSSSSTSEPFVAAIRGALTEYFEIAKTPEFHDDPILSFRIANAFALRGEQELALDKYREAQAYLKSSSLPADHYMRLRIPKQLGVALWDVGERMKRSGEELGSSEAFVERRLNLYLEALRTTKAVYGLKINEGTLDRRLTGKFSEDDLTANNILDFSACFIRAGGKQEVLDAEGVTRPYIDELLRRITAGGVSAIDRLTVADTVRSAAALFGNKALAREAAKRVLELIKNRDITLLFSKQAYEEVKSEAERELED